jgi:hypothetical protein
MTCNGTKFLSMWMFAAVSTSMAPNARTATTIKTERRLHVPEALAFNPLQELLFGQAELLGSPNITLAFVRSLRSSPSRWV